MKIDWGTLRLQSTITPTILNEFRFQYARDFEFEFSQTPAPGEPRTGINGSAPDVFLTNGLEFGKPTFLERAAYPEEKRTQFTDNVTVSHGPHTIKFGFDINHASDKLSNLRTESGSYSYSNINDFIIDYTNWTVGLPATVPCVNTANRFRGKCYTSNYTQGFGVLGTSLSTNDYGFYGQIDWKFTPRVTINLGLRYEYETMPDVILPNSSTVVIPNTVLTLNQATSQLPSDRNNWGPRIGFAVDLTGNGKTSLRGGWGLYYGRIINSTIYNALINTGNPGGQSQSSVAGSAATAPIFPNTLASAPPGTGSIQYFAPNFQSPMIHQGDLIIEREIMRNTSVSASYLVSLGYNLPNFIDRNLGIPNTTQSFPIVGGPFGGQTLNVQEFPTTRPLTTFAQLTEISSSVKSEYNALVLQLNRRFSSGLQFAANYTLSKAVDLNQTSTTFTTNNVPFNVFDLGFERGVSNFDVRHKFVVNAIYAPRVTVDNGVMKAILDGWTIAPIFQYYTGQPFSGTISGSNGGAGGINRSAGSTRFPLLDRNSFRFPAIANVDFRLSRRFHIKERVSLEALGEVFNLFNRTQVTGKNSTLYTLQSNGSLNYNTAFGTVTSAASTIFRQRQVQIAFRLQF